MQIRRQGLSLTASAFILGCGMGVFDNYAPLTVFDNFHAIEDGVAYRSAQLDPQTLELVFQQYGIRTVINLRGRHEEQTWYRNEQAVADAAGVMLVDVEMSADRLPSREVLLQLYDTFLTAEYPILIHCQAGADRTGAAAAIWRMVVRGDPREAAAAELCPGYGHFEAVHPEMDRLVRIFQADREWIEHEYPSECGEPRD